MNNKTLWLTKHWGLGIGVLMTISGIVMASPGYMQSWVISQANNKAPFFSIKYKTISITREDEDVPSGYKPIKFIPDNHELKGLGTSMMLLGTSLLFDMRGVFLCIQVPYNFQVNDRKMDKCWLPTISIYTQEPFSYFIV